MAKECLCTKCSFGQVCEYRNNTTKYCIDYNGSLSSLYTEDELKIRLKEDRKAELRMAIGFLSLIAIGIFFIIGKELITQDGWFMTSVLPSVIGILQPVLTVLLNGFVAIVHFICILVLLAGVVFGVVWFVRSIHVISIHIQRKVTKGGKTHA